MGIYKKVKFEGPSRDDKINIEVWTGNKNWYQLLGSPFTNNCSHEWITTIGFSSEYVDCAKCGIKKEEV